MDLYEWSIEIVKLIRGNPFVKISIILVSAGIALLSQPLWLPPLDAFLQQQGNLIYYRDQVSYTGWGLIFLGVSVLVYYERRNSPTVKTAEQKPDQECILGEALECTIHISESVQCSHLFSLINKEELLLLIQNELESHPIFAEIDYESIPIPLKKEYYIIVSKNNNDIIIEEISNHLPNEELTVKWKDLSGKYIKAYRLPYRTNKNILKNRIKYAQSIDAVDNIIISLTSYVRQSKIYNNKELYKRLHNLKGRIETSRNLAEVNYIKYLNGGDPEEFISKVVLNLEMVVSCTHKIIVEYVPPK